jgi:hypothetical protein
MTSVPLGNGQGGGDVAALFSEIWVADFEFRADPGEHPWPVCMVAEEIKTRRVIRLWRNDRASAAIVARRQSADRQRRDAHAVFHRGARHSYQRSHNPAAGRSADLCRPNRQTAAATTTTPARARWTATIRLRGAQVCFLLLGDREADQQHSSGFFIPTGGNFL